MTIPVNPPAHHSAPNQSAGLYDELPGNVTEVFGAEATAESAYDLLTVDVPAGGWIAALETARDRLGCTYFDWLSAVDEPGTGFRVCAHVVALDGGRVRRLMLRTTVPHAAAALPTAIPVYAGAAWHERETFEMFGVTFTDHPHLVPLLLPENFEGHPLRKDFVLAARVAKAWPGAKEPGEGADPDGPKRRQMLPPGVPDPNDWGPMKGQLPPAPARPARTPRAAGEAPPRRAARTEGAPAEGAAPRTPRAARAAAEGTPPGAAPAERPARTPRVTPAEGAAPRTPRTAPAESAAEPRPAPAPAPTEADPSAEVPAAESGPPTAAPVTDTPSTAATPATPPTPGDAATPADPAAPAPADPAATARPPRRSRSAADGSASQAAPAPAPAPEPEATRPAPRSADAPWHHARPAFDPAEAVPPVAAPADADPAEATPPADTDTDPHPEPDTGGTA